MSPTSISRCLGLNVQSEVIATVYSVASTAVPRHKADIMSTEALVLISANVLCISVPWLCFITNLRVSLSVGACQENSGPGTDRKSTRLNSSHLGISYAVFRLKKKKTTQTHNS